MSYIHTYLHTQVIYVVLSFTAKTFLAADVFGGLAAASKDWKGREGKGRKRERHTQSYKWGKTSCYFVEHTYIHKWVDKWIIRGTTIPNECMHAFKVSFVEPRHLHVHTHIMVITLHCMVSFSFFAFPFFSCGRPTTPLFSHTYEGASRHKY